jgi:hypothetical protein
MKKHCVRILSAFLGLAALAIAAKADYVDHIVVNVPYEFVVDGTTLPAGRYTVKPIGEQDKKVLVISSYENHAVMMVLSTAISEKTGAGQPSVSFRQVGEQHLLSKIQTEEHVFTIPVKELGK